MLSVAWVLVRRWWTRALVEWKLCRLYGMTVCSCVSTFPLILVYLDPFLFLYLSVLKAW